MPLKFTSNNDVTRHHRLPLEYRRIQAQLPAVDGKAPALLTRSNTDFGRATQIRPISAAGSSAITISGMPVPYNVASQDLGGFVEKYQAGCFNGSLKDKHLSVFLDHSHTVDKLLGRVATGTATFTDTKEGLVCACDLPDTPAAKVLISQMRAGNVDQMSAGFFITKQRWIENVKPPVRIVEEGRLLECSIVCFGAYGDAATAGIENQDYDDDEEEMLAASRPMPGLATRAAASPILSTEQRIANLRALIRELPTSKHRKVDEDYIRAMIAGLPESREKNELRLELMRL
jgi:HK97 family phage prohead protease